jgi:hypothetical protein
MIEERCEFLSYGGRRREVRVSAYEYRDRSVTIEVPGWCSLNFMTPEQFGIFMKMLNRFNEKLVYSP